ncbi:SMEK domain-containing protein [Flavobacterium sp. LHD-80]|uniref:SMEK domain-containing protein n=1 Tax=Flavobacterium sp. LHD-80 TaxID=3071411 RepID=UPI0027DF1FD2|nr:SMEK domain-containing protein [Flavobacterium sp. LHD-80]MDQ6472756.1 SMEK domain-containing protein [Flavobacterium sp. LHD-80]
MKRELLIKEIIDELSILKNKLDFLSVGNLHDINIISEYHIQEILNIILNLNLISSNSVTKNAVSIDLEDRDNKIAVQVTATNNKVKVQETLDKFFLNNLNEKFEILLVFILGKKQKTYNNLRINEGFYFNAKEHILDFTDIVLKFPTLPTAKIEKIRNVLKNDKLPGIKKENPVNRFKKNFAIKNEICNKLYKRNLSVKDREILYYIPYRSFVYDSLIIRSIDDVSYPNIDDDENHPISTWYRAQIHDISEYGIETMVPSSFDLVMNESGKWNFLNQRDKNKLPLRINYLRATILQRIPFDNIIKLDMNPDPVYGYPTLYVEYKNDKKPFSEEIPFLIGYYHDENDCRKVHYFELSEKDENL